MTESTGKSDALPEIRVPALWTFVGLAGGLAAGLLARGTAAEAPLLALAGPIGTLWLRALQMTIVPLVVALLFTGIVRTVAAAAEVHRRSVRAPQRAAVCVGRTANRIKCGTKRSAASSRLIKWSSTRPRK